MRRLLAAFVGAVLVLMVALLGFWIPTWHPMARVGYVVGGALVAPGGIAGYLLGGGNVHGEVAFVVLWVGNILFYTLVIYWILGRKRNKGHGRRRG